MKKAICQLFSVLVPSLLFIADINAQGLCKNTFSKGQVLHYTRTDFPDPFLIDNKYIFLKGKKKEAFDKKFMEEVAEGKHPSKSYNFDMTVSSVQTVGSESITEVTFESAGVKYLSYVVCAKDTLFGIKSMSGYPMLDKQDTIGFFKPGITRYPLNMKVGDVLPLTTDLAYTFPKNFDMSYKKQVVDHVTTTKTAEVIGNGIVTTTSTQTFFKEVTKELKYDIQFSAPTVTYRHVVGEGEVVVNGKTYKALKIELSLETKTEDMITNVNADDMLQKWALEFTNKYIVKKVNKSEHLKNGGFEWFVPELGTIVAVEMFTESGIPLHKSQLISYQ